MKILLPKHRRSTIFKSQSSSEIQIMKIIEWEEVIRDFDLVIPLSLEQIRAVYELGLDTSKMVLPNRRAQELCNYKLALNSFLIQAGLGENIPILFPSEFPMIKKPSIGRSSSGIEILLDEVDIDYQELLENEFFLQEFIPGEVEFSVNGVIEDNKVKFSIDCSYSLEENGMAFFKDYDTRLERFEDGSDVLFETSDPVLNFIETVCEVIDYGSGAFHMGYKVQDGVIKLIEINPRWSAGSIFCMDEMVNAFKEIVDKRLS